MARRNPELEERDRMIEMLRFQIETMRVDPGDIPDIGCGDHSCIVHTVTGMGTNGGCRCDERKLRRAVMWWRRKAQFLEVTIRDMRDGRGDDPV